MRGQLAEVAGLLPDIPQWIEVRSMLLQGQARLVGPVSSSPITFVALHRDGEQAVVVGRASHAAILAAAASAKEILSAPEDESWTTSALTNWKMERAVLFRRPRESPLPTIASGEVRFLTAGELAAITRGALSLRPETLGEELSSAETSGSPIAAAFEGGCPAAFCYAGSITETLWDVSIDTLAPYQRRGHATRAVAFLIEHYHALGKEPVWGALVSNHASAALAARLGFAPVGSLSIFSAPPGNAPGAR